MHPRVVQSECLDVLRQPVSKPGPVAQESLRIRVQQLPPLECKTPSRVTQSWYNRLYLQWCIIDLNTKSIQDTFNAAVTGSGELPATGRVISFYLRPNQPGSAKRMPAMLTFA